MEELKYVDRRNTNCGKWDGLSYMFGRDDLIAMWVADMDFQAPGCVKEAMMHYVEQGVFGYYAVPPSYYDAFLEWEKKHYDFQVEKEWIRFSPGVVAGFSWAIQIMTDPGDAVIVMTPVYYPFMNAIKNNKRKLITCDLKNQKGIYTIDYDNFEKKIEENQVKLFIMCSPHNPVGRVWKKEELSRMLEICKKHHVMVISDEIHQDLTYEGHKNIPALLDEEYHDMLISMTAPSKTFNLAGVQNSIILIANNALRQKWDQFVEGIRVKSGNTFGYIAAEAAYRGGEEWYEAVKCQIVKNFHYLSDTLKEKLPQVVVSPLEGTYLAWVDLRAYEKTEKIKDKIINECKLAVDFGDWFGGERYRGFIRMNLATSFENVVTAVDGLVHCFK
ncbi:MalY/PatB family protein [Bariatricus sp. HCP28S3_A7]|uniref:MalY/PatB family protein n=1 Tax=Bariatricus sp. HCP28S3_A7 TaxID=3438894 RepID=UPI003F89E612